MFNNPCGVALKRASRQAGLILLMAAGMALLNTGLNPRRPAWPSASSRVNEVSLHSLRDNPAWPQILWIDARPQPAFDAGHIPGAVRLTETEWETLLPAVMDDWRPGLLVVVYCASGGCDTSQAVASRLKHELGLSTIDVLTGGWPAWEGTRP